LGDFGIGLALEVLQVHAFEHGRELDGGFLRQVDGAVLILGIEANLV